MNANMTRKTQAGVCGMAAGWLRRNFHIWSGVYRPNIRRAKGWERTQEGEGWFPTVVIDADLSSWALPFAIHAGGPLLGKPGFHFRIGPINIGWSKL